MNRRVSAETDLEPKSVAGSFLSLFVSMVVLLIAAAVETLMVGVLARTLLPDLGEDAITIVGVTGALLLVLVSRPLVRGWWRRRAKGERMAWWVFVVGVLYLLALGILPGFLIIWGWREHERAVSAVTRRRAGWRRTMIAFLLVVLLAVAGAVAGSETASSTYTLVVTVIVLVGSMGAGILFRSPVAGALWGGLICLAGWTPSVTRLPDWMDEALAVAVLGVLIGLAAGMTAFLVVRRRRRKAAADVSRPPQNLAER